MRNWHEEDDVTVVYPNGSVQNGTIARCRTDGRYCVVFTREDGSDVADPKVMEHWMRVPGASAQAVMEE